MNRWAAWAVAVVISLAACSLYGNPPTTQATPATTPPTTVPTSDDYKRMIRAVEPMPGAVGRYQLVAGKSLTTDTVYRIDTQTGQVWRLEETMQKGSIGAFWLALPPRCPAL